MTYNVEWFSEDANPGRVSNLKAVLDETAPDVVGLQEIQSRKALGQVFGGEWQIGMTDDPDDAQELAIAVRKPHVLVSSEMVFPGPTFEEFFPNGRDALRAVVQTPSGRRLIVYVLHLKSRRGGRMQTDFQREGAAGLLAAYIAARPDERNVVVLGDLNDTPNDRSARILATGDLTVPAGDAKPPRWLLQNLMTPLWDEDYVTIGVSSLFQGSALVPRVPGAKADSDRLRGVDYRFPDDVRVRQTLFDQILASPAVAKTARERPTVFAGPAAMRGQGGRVVVEEGRPVQYTEKGDRASDHLPVYVDVAVPEEPATTVGG